MAQSPSPGARWPVKNPAIIQLYSMATPNGKKVGVALEELGLEYEPHLVDIGKGEQHTDEFRAISPNSKIPILVDPQGYRGRAMTIMESGAILWHLANKTGKLIPEDPVERSECLQWLFFQVGHIGPMFGQFGHFHRFAREQCEHPYPLERYRAESQRLVGVLDQHLSARSYLAGEDYSIADIAVFPWIGTMLDFYGAGELIAFGSYGNVARWYERCVTRPAAERGAKVCAP